VARLDDRLRVVLGRRMRNQPALNRATVSPE
jgi:hypothetical protein